MKISARNMFQGKVLKVVNGAVNCEVELQVAPGIVITSVITKASVKKLGLKRGKQAYAVIKSSSVLLATD